MAKKETPEITINREITTKKGKVITEFQAKRLVTKTGTGGHIILPTSLIGKYVEVYYKEENEKV